MSTTLDNGVVIPVGTDPVQMATALAAMAHSFSDAIGGLGTGARQPRRFRTANQTTKTDLAAVIDPIPGDEVFVEDTEWWERYDGISTPGGWSIYQTTKPIPYDGFPSSALGSGGSQYCSYELTGDLVTAWGYLACGAGGTLNGQIILPFMQGAAGITGGGAQTIGTCHAGRAGAGPWHGMVINTASSTVTTATLWFDAGATDGRMSQMSNSLLGTFTLGDNISFQIQYQRR